MKTSLCPAELAALLTTLDDLGPDVLSSCPGWSAHHLAAHIAGNYEEVGQHVEAYAAGRTLEHTRSWEEREAPLRELTHSTLLGRIESEAAHASSITQEILDTDPAAELTWTNRTVKVSGFPTHMRSEDALHRWDLAGDDDTSNELLGQHELLVHAVTFIGQPLLRRGRHQLGAMKPFLGRIRSPGRDDLIVDYRDDPARLITGSLEGSADIEGDPAARLLLLWGRKPTPFSRLAMPGDHAIAFALQSVLAGY